MLFYSTWEISSFIHVNIQIPPQACVSEALQHLADQITMAAFSLMRQPCCMPKITFSSTHFHFDCQGAGSATQHFQFILYFRFSNVEVFFQFLFHLCFLGFVSFLFSVQSVLSSMFTANYVHAFVSLICFLESLLVFRVSPCVSCLCSMFYPVFK